MHLNCIISHIYLSKYLFLMITEVSEDMFVSHCAIFGHIFVPDKQT